MGEITKQRRNLLKVPVIGAFTLGLECYRVSLDLEESLKLGYACSVILGRVLLSAPQGIQTKMTIEIV